MGAILAVAGQVMLVQATRSARAVRRWTQAAGTVTASNPQHLSDDGRQWWDLEVAYRDATGTTQRTTKRTLGHRVPSRTGEEVRVWFDPDHPERAKVTLGENAPSSSWLSYALGAAVFVAGVAVFTVAYLTRP